MTDDKVINILYTDNAGNGLSRTMQVDEGTTIGSLMADRVGSIDPDDHMVRLNGLPTSAKVVLTEGDSVAVTPTNVKGAI